MIVHDVVQGSLEWHALRIGIPTASEFHKIITPAKGLLSKSARKYAYWLVTEAVLNESLSPLQNLEWIDRGKAMEPQAVQQFEFTYDVQTTRVGFVTTDDKRMGASPDRLIVGRNGALETKCPAPHTHMEYWLDGPGEDYRPQVQGQLLVAELDTNTFYSYHPHLPPAVIEYGRDDNYIAKMEDALDQFCDMKDEMLERALKTGFFDEKRGLKTAYDGIAEEAALQGILDGSRGASWGG